MGVTYNNVSITFPKFIFQICIDVLKKELCHTTRVFIDAMLLTDGVCESTLSCVACLISKCVDNFITRGYIKEPWRIMAGFWSERNTIAIYCCRYIPIGLVEGGSFWCRNILIIWTPGNGDVTPRCC